MKFELVSPYERNQSQCTIQYLRETKTCEEDDLNDWTTSKFARVNGSWF